MRNYTLRTTLKESSLFSLLLITLWVLSVCATCKFENSDNQIQDQNNDIAYSSKDQDPDTVAETATEELTWSCIRCKNENGQYETMCQKCNLIKQQENAVDSPEEREDNEARDLQEALDAADPNKDRCPVCLDWFTKEQQMECKYFKCDHFICTECYQMMKRKKKLSFVCPLCKREPKDSSLGQPK